MSKPSAPMPLRAMTEPDRERGGNVVRHRDDVVAQQDEEVVAEPVVLAQVHRDESPSRLSTVLQRIGLFGRVDPDDPRVAAEPALLAHRELTRAGDREVDGFVEPHVAPHVGEQLAVAERLRGRA